MNQILEGTGEEIAVSLRDKVYAGLRLKVTVESEPIDLAAGIREPLITLTDDAHLEELLLEGPHWQARDITDQTLDERMNEVMS